VKLLYKPVSIIGGLLAGVAARAVFKRTWKVVARQERKPTAKDKQSGWVVVVAAATIEGAVSGAIKAAVDRAGARGFEWATGIWPGNAEKPAKRRSPTRP
jgi:hypothetical protein